MTFRQYQDVAVVEHDDSTRQPREGGEIYCAVVTGVKGRTVLVHKETGGYEAYDAESGWPVWTNRHGWRLVPLCTRCDEPILGTPVTSPSDPLQRQYCGDGCLTAAAEGAGEQMYQPGVAT